MPVGTLGDNLDSRLLALFQLGEYSVYIVLGKSPQGQGANIACGADARQERRHGRIIRRFKYINDIVTY